MVACDRERERECVCLCMYVCMYVCASECVSEQLSGWRRGQRGRTYACVHPHLRVLLTVRVRMRVRYV